MDGDIPDAQTDRSKLLEWIEKQGQESLKTRFATAELIAKEAQTTLTVLFAGAGGTAAYAAKLLEPGPAGPVAFASAVVCLYLVLLCVLLVLGCMMFLSYPALYQDPANLRISAPFDEIRDAAIDELDGRVKEAAELNAKRAKKLNRIRLAASLSPLLFAAAAAFAPKASERPLEKSTLICSSEPAGSAGATSLRCTLTH